MTDYQRLQIEEKQEWKKEIELIPFIQFPPEWRVQVLPPYSDATVRFVIMLPSGVLKSVYLDTRNALGTYKNKGVDYWEVYPYKDDTGRCEMNEVAELLRMIGDETGEVLL